MSTRDLIRIIGNLTDSVLLNAKALSHAMDTRTDVALILWNPDVIQLVSFVLRQRDLKSCGVEPSGGTERLEELLASCRPSVVLFDLAPPYIRSAAVARYLLNRFPDCSFAMTCADPMLALNTAPWLACHPLFQKPYEIDEIGDVVRSMVNVARKSNEFRLEPFMAN